MGILVKFFDKRKMEKRQKYKNDVQPYISEGLIREVYEGDGLTLTCFVNSSYAVFVHGMIDKTNNLSVGAVLKGSHEFTTFMEEPTLENFKSFRTAMKIAGQKRAFTPTPELMAKFRELKIKLEAENKVEVDLEMEKRLVETAKGKKYN